jgi:hypothetical protein
MKENRIVVLQSEQENLVEWIEENHKSFKLNNHGSGKYCHIQAIKDQFNDETVYDTIQKIKSRLIEKENLQNYKSFTELPDLVYYMEPGSKLHIHDDSGYKTSKGIHVRFNVCLQKPEIGGRPVYAGNIIELIEREYIICRAELDYHSSEWISGNKAKINLSFGFLIDGNDIKNFSGRENIVGVTNYDETINIYTSNCDDFDFNNYINAKLMTTKHILQSAAEINDELDSYIMNIVNFNCNLQNINFSFDKQFVEVEFFNRPLQEFKTDYNRITKSAPILSLICFTEDFSSPIMVTNIDHESYKYKEIPSENTFVLVMPRKNTHFMLNGLNVYGNYNRLASEKVSFDHCLFMKINVWNKTLKTGCNEATNDYVCTPLIGFYSKQNTVTETIFGSNILENIIYDTGYKCIQVDKILEKTSNDINVIVVHNKYKPLLEFSTLLDKYGDVAEDLYLLFKHEPLGISNRFYNNKIFLKGLSLDVCYWIINESEKTNKWVDSPYHQYDKYLNVEKIPAVLSFVLFSSNFYLLKFREEFKLPENINFNINDIFIAKMSKSHRNCQGYQYQHHFIVHIQLNDLKDFEGGKLIFDDNSESESIILKQGDMLLFNSTKPYKFDGITEGECYMLVMFLSLQ